MNREIHELMSHAKTLDELYQATSFWNADLHLIKMDLENEGFENFRRWPNSLRFFAPTYGAPGNSLTPELIDKLFDWSNKNVLNPKQASFVRSWATGRLQAENDFRVVKSAVMGTANEFLLDFSESDIGNPIERLVVDTKAHSRSSMNYLMGLACLSKFVELKSLRSVLEIGGGYGTLGEILHQLWGGEIKYLNLDIPPICNVAEYYLNSVSADFLGIQQLDQMETIRIEQLKSLNVAPNWKVEALVGDIDLFVNMISFQEMERPVVENYLQKVQTLRPEYILLRHIREGKQRRTATNPVGVIEPTTPDIYDEILDTHRRLHRDSVPFGFDTSDGFHSEVLVFEKK